MATFWQSFTEQTGWRLDQRSRSVGAPKLLPVVSADQSTLSKAAARMLAESAANLIVRLREAEQAVIRQEAELVVTTTPLADPEQQSDFSARLSDVLMGAAEGTGCVAAAFYMLDDDTSSLKMRAQYGLQPPRLVEAPRSLRGALADLEAMVSDVVAIEDCHSTDEVYSSPEPFASAICAVVAEGGVPIGTLWIWNNIAMDIDSTALAVARLAASSIASEIRAERLLRRVRSEQKTDITLKAVSMWQELQLPPAMPLAKGWYVDGCSHSDSPVAGSWHTWDILPDGQIGFAVAEAHSESLDKAMIAATARAAFQSHSGYRLKPSQLVRRVADTLWQTNTGEQLVSLLYANIDPETGQGVLTCAGSTHAMVLSSYGFRVLTKDSQPLCSFPDYQPVDIAFRLQPGEVLWAATGNMIKSAERNKRGWTQQEIAAIVSEHIQAGPHEVIPALWRSIVNADSVGDCTAAILCRQ